MRNLSHGSEIGVVEGDIVAAAFGWKRSAVVDSAKAKRHRLFLCVAGALVAVSVAGGLLAKREPIVRAFPQLAPAYAALGLVTNLRGFEFGHVSARFEDLGGGRFLAVEGVLRNVTKQTRDAPRLRISLSDAKGTPIYFWAASSGVKALPAGGAAPFHAKLAAPPAEAQSVTVDFMP
jgi:hypothetical protein